jgi:ATP adenylyltransferase
MIVANEHVDFFDALSDKASSDIIKTLSKVKSILKKTIKPGGFNIGLNVGKVAGAGVDKHLHIHLVPRWQGDTNFMPVLAGTKLISQSLNDLYRKMKKEIKEVK